MRHFALLLLATACSVDRAGLADFDDGGRRDAGRDCVPRTETCNELDDDCDGIVDEVAEERCGTELEVGICTPGLYRCASGERRCEGAVLPATEACDNGLDDDCDGDTDEECGCAPGASESCGTSDRGECRFGSRTCTSEGVFGECLGALDASAESCNGLDDDCDGETDEGLRQPFYRDSDGDGFGSSGTVVAACSPPEGFVADDRDCNDTCRECYPGRDEVCDTLDNDCDTRTDEGLRETVWRDADRDGYGDTSMPLETCDVPDGYAKADGDCNDSDGAVRPNAVELCNSRDDNCEGTVDEGCMAECNRVVRAGHRYHFCRVAYRWTDARDFCDTLGAALLTVDDAEENAFARTAADGGGGGDWWIGLNDREDEGTWRWDSGSSSGYRNWGSLEPNNLANEDCVSMRPDARWNDSGCNSNLRFVCEAAP